MKVKILLLIILSTIIFQQQLLSRIDETREQCVRRYGGSVNYDEENNLFQYEKGEFFIVIHYFKNKVDAITYMKLDKEDQSITLPITDNEVDNILKLNGKKRIWKSMETKGVSKNKLWKTEEGDYFAAYKISENYLIISTKEYAARQKMKKKEQEDQKMEGL
ncbi:MAG: hypothetical protein JXR69_00130 [Candidatus Delongbacteria bacterium]|nr:hypothetical protein [Candidatus Delongbacteria bacterium]